VLKLQKNFKMEKKGLWGSDQFCDEVKIPEERLAVLIGSGGKVRRKIEKELNVKIWIDSEEHNVFVKGEDSLKILIACNIVRAIGRGFSPENALLLLKDDVCFEVVDVTEFSGKSKKKLYRFRSRLIGTEGKCRETIENYANVHVSIYGKTVGIIGKVDDVAVAKRAVVDLLKGAPHGRVYKRVREKS